MSNDREATSTRCQTSPDSSPSNDESIAGDAVQNGSGATNEDPRPRIGLLEMPCHPVMGVVP